MEIHVSVRSLVEFILRSGDIDNRKAAFSPEAMQEGGRIHRMIQRRMGAEYHAEVGLRYIHKTESYDIVIEGRADGIIIESMENMSTVPELTQEGLIAENESSKSDITDKISVTIDEIKGTYHDITKMKQAIPVHLAQAKC